MKVKISLFYFIIEIIYGIYGGDILAMVCVPTYSYYNIMKSIVSNLANEHHITFISIVDDNYFHPNVTFLKIKVPQINMKMHLDTVYKDLLLTEKTNEKAALNTVLFDNYEYFKEMLNNEAFLNLLQNKPKYDLLITFTVLSEHVLQFADYLNIPLVQVAASYQLPWQNDAISNPYFISTQYNILQSDDYDTFFKRFIKYIKALKLMYQYKLHLRKLNEVTRTFFGKHITSIENISKNTSLLIVNTNQVISYTQATVPNLIEIGGIHCKPAQKLPKKLNEFVEGGNKNGLIYVSFGSTVPNFMPTELTNSIINVFRKIPQRVLWKIGQDIPNLPENVKIIKWCPQQDILGHKNTKLFITQGGLLSIQESIYHGVPILVMPITFEQPVNARIAQKLGYGRYLRFLNFSENHFLYEINEILSNSKYTDKVKQLSILINDVQLTASDKLKWWINYIIKYKGYPLHTNLETQFHWARWIEIDICIFLIFIQILLIFFIIVSIYIFKTLLKNNFNIKIRKKDL